MLPETSWPLRRSRRRRDATDQNEGELEPRNGTRCILFSCLLAPRSFSGAARIQLRNCTLEGLFKLFALVLGGGFVIRE